MRKAAAMAPCVACMIEVSVLEGIRCPADENRHFFCDECFDGWVKSESETAPEHIPKDAGEVWCMCKAKKDSDDGCSSKRPFSPQEVASHVQPSTYAAYLKARADVKEAELSLQHEKRMQAFEARLRKELNDQVTPCTHGQHSEAPESLAHRQDP
eukprot:jgi/Ulvmu1/10712/UM067_0039.1